MARLSPMDVFTLQTVLAALCYFCLGWWYVYPLLSRRPASTAMPIALLPFALRFIGAACMVVGVTGTNYPVDAAWIVLVGDCACAVLALAAIGAYRYEARIAPALALLTVAESIGYGGYYVAVTDLPRTVENLHAHWYVATMIVPLLVLDNILVAALLWRFRSARRSASAPQP